MGNKVAAVLCRSYEQEEVDRGVEEAIQKIGFVIPSGKKVLIKPNIMSQNRPLQHTITHYSVVHALCRLLRKAECQIYIGESIAFYQKGLTRKAFRVSGIEEVAREFGATLVCFEEVPLRKIEKGLAGLPELYLPEILFDMDLIINACKLKSHGALRLSGAIKNLYGCLLGGYKQKIHRWTDSEFSFADVLIDIHKSLGPVLHVMDAVVSLDGGPTALGRPVQTSRILASENPAAMDVVAGRMIGYEPEEVPILLQAKDRGVIGDFHDIQVLGETGTFSFRHLVKGDLYRKTDPDSFFVKHTYVDVVAKATKCDCCKKCISACPVDAICCNGQNVFINRQKCINCYRCFFACPKGAVRIKASKINKIIRLLRRISRL